MSYVVANPLLKEHSGHSVEYEALRGQPGPNKRSTCLNTWGVVALGAGLCIMVLYFIITGASEYRPSSGGTSYSAVIDTQNGPVQGVSYVANGTDYRIEAEGHPFARPPVGDLRWKMPEPVSYQWEGVLEAMSLKPACVQPDGTGQRIVCT